MLKTRAGDVIGSGDPQQLSLFPGQTDADVLLTRAEAAAYLRRSVPTLESWSRQGFGPRMVRMGRRGVRYRLSDLRRYIEEGATTVGAE
jgi:hypothetical protein